MRPLKLKLRLAEPLRPTELQVTLMYAGLVGLMGACAGVLFRTAIAAVQAALWGVEGDLVRAAEQVDLWRRVVVPALGGLAAGFVIQAGSRLHRGQTSADFMEAVALREGVIRFRPSLVKSASSLVTVASGGSIGREGAMVQLSSMLASWMGRHTGLSKPRLELLVACGAAAGIASAYNAPIAGALFVAEIVLGSIAMQSLGPLVFASVISTVTTRQLLGAGPVFEIPPFELVSPWELFPYLVLGLLLGLLAPWFVRLLRASERLFARLPASIPVRMLVGGLIVGLLSIWRPEVWGNGNTAIDSILKAGWVWHGLVWVLAFKLLATAATVGSGAVGGVFTPTLFVGAAAGYLFGMPVHGAWPASTAQASAYALVGMGCFLAATTHAPLMAMLMLFEMTLDYGIVLPLMLSCVVAYYTSLGISKESIYAESLKRKSAGAEPRPLAEMTIGSLIKPDPPHVGEHARFGELVEAFKESRYNYIYVTTADGRLLGAVSLHDIKSHLEEPLLADLLIASELMRENFPSLESETTLGEALETFLLHDGERLPVVSDARERRLVGSLSKTDLLLTLAHGRKPKAPPPAEPGSPSAGAAPPPARAVGG
ncbi:MAG TPA: ClcB-like voltage-gated chloride channel protein [Planctomycetota bacterium]|nr:ClcB-like voltage-gated chloride channel protein [Planctomycetota bacterium]